MSRRRSLLIAAIGASAIAAAFGAVVFGGVVNVAATEPEPALVQWLLATAMKSSVQNHASSIAVPAGLDLRDPDLAQRAFGHYSVACTPCHGAPGVASAPWLVLDPPARSLVETADAWKDGELYWIVKHGIQMTGMPALGPTHEDADLWAIAAFVRQLPEMTAEQYQTMGEVHAAAHADHGGHGMAAAPAKEPAPLEVTLDVDAVETVPVAESSTPTPAPKAKRPSRKPRTPAISNAPAVAAPQAPVVAPHDEHAHHHHGSP